MKADLTETERTILAAALVEPETWPKVSALRPEDWSLDAHRVIYRRMRDVMESGSSLDYITLSTELQKHGELQRIGGVGYITELVSLLSSGLARTMNVADYVRMVKQSAGVRRIALAAEAISKQAATDPSASISDLVARLTDLGREAAQYEGGGGICSLSDVPDVFSFDAGSISYLVPDLIPHGSLVLLTGAPGVGKSSLALKMAISCCIGSSFLDRQCERIRCLYLDKENPLFLVQQRIDTFGGGPVPGLHIWGSWIADEPPMLGDARLLKIAADEKPLIVIDSLVRFHTADENSASEMRVVMEHLRRLTAAGATVIVLHHCSKSEGSKYRGSSDILAGVDVGYTLTAEDDGLLQLRRFKSRFSPEATLTISPDFGNGTFELAESSAAAERRDDVATISELIRRSPGITTNRIVSDSGIRRQRALELLDSHCGELWQWEAGPRGAKLYYSMTGSHAGTSSQHSEPVPVPVPALIERNRELVVRTSGGAHHE